jgi:hypothetical protein
MEDSITGIFKCLSDCAQISKGAGGIGFNISNIRAKNSFIHGTGGNSNGIIPMLRVFNNTALYVNQCFHPETIIYTNFGAKRASDITLSDKVVTEDGSFKPILEIIKNKVSTILNKKITFTESTDNKKRIITLSFKLSSKPTSSEIEELNNVFELEKTKSLDIWEISKDKLNWKIILD